VRIVMAWLVGFVIALGAFNHAIVSTIELVSAYGSAPTSTYPSGWRTSVSPSAGIWWAD
jgi:hypothetical protein